MKIKIISTSIILLLGFLILSNCKKKDDPDPMDEIPTHNFINQNMKGKIGGKTWEFESGHKVILTGGGPANLYHFKLSDTTITGDACNFYGYGDHQLSLGLNGNSLDAKVYGLGPNLNTAQFIFPSAPTTKGTGAIEIISVDYNKKVITGRIDVTADSNNTLNGNFKIYICQ